MWTPGMSLPLEKEGMNCWAGMQNCKENMIHKNGSLYKIPNQAKKSKARHSRAREQALHRKPSASSGLQQHPGRNCSFWVTQLHAWANSSHLPEHTLTKNFLIQSLLWDLFTRRYLLISAILQKIIFQENKKLIIKKMLLNWHVSVEFLCLPVWYQ